MSGRGLLLIALLVVGTGCSTTPTAGVPAGPAGPELTTGQKVLNVAGAPLRYLGAAIVLPVKLLFYDAPRGLWNVTLADDQLDLLTAQLSARDAVQRAAAAEQLGAAASQLDPEDRRSVAAALVPLLDDPSVEVRSRALLALSGTGAGWTVPRVVRRLKDPAHAVRASAVIALGELGDLRPVRLLVQMYDSPWGEHWFVRTSLIQAAGKLGIGDLLPRIREELSRPQPDGDWLMTVVVFQALARLEDHAATAELRRSLSHENAYVRTAAAMALGELGERDTLRAALARSSSADQQLPLVLAIGRHGEPADRDRMVPLLKSPDGRVRAHAAGAMADLGDPRGVEAMIGGVQSGIVYERLYCLGRLQKLAGRDDTPGFDQRAWREWWDDNRDDIELGRQ